jgi:hypothetical protein
MRIFNRPFAAQSDAAAYAGHPRDPHYDELQVTGNYLEKP